jgi:hypothetical protein
MCLYGPPRRHPALARRLVGDAGEAPPASDDDEEPEATASPVLFLLAH